MSIDYFIRVTEKLSLVLFLWLFVTFHSHRGPQFLYSSRISQAPTKPSELYLVMKCPSNLNVIILKCNISVIITCHCISTLK